MAQNIPDDLRYTRSDEWVRRQDGELITGITAYASEQLGDVVYLQMPEVGKRFGQGEAYGEIESVKAVSELYCPLAGEVLETNDELDANPGLVNDDPYGNGWIARLRADNLDDYDALLDAAAYERHIAERT
jgi:glycine cleavage system H protein